MIRFVHGNLFDSRAEALVNTVNCVGVMGKGIAHQFKRAYPRMFNDYASKCRRGEIRLGETTSFRESGKIVINFPTKGHWRASSRFEDIVTGLHSLRELIARERIRSIALPPLGCGNGGLEWSQVKRAIIRELEDLNDVDIEVYEPTVRFESQVAQEPKVSLSHFVLAGLRVGLQRPTKLTIQKAAYFFNVYADTEYFRFTEYKFGPYCVGIEPMLNTIRDYLAFTKMDAQAMLQDGRNRKLAGNDADRLRAWNAAINAATTICNKTADKLEAVATAHAVIARKGFLSHDRLVPDFLSWSKEKSERYQEDDVLEAARILEREGLIRRTLLGFECCTPRPYSAEIRATATNQDSVR
ncbi:macro domain-containing protein [Archangium gephyra]|uniref:type II toxin-antitoxin system antitoxin DNA ADP-ribosyl glycohydrolase DarG n=1 Tax=Archangium gephyra TaxID=48 RepID=UPI0035D5092E